MDPALDRTGIAFNRACRHAISSNHRITFANAHTHATVGTPMIIDHRLFLDHFNGIHRAVPHAKPASSAFINVDLHKLNRVAF
jgi:hypothetical protein